MIHTAPLAKTAPTTRAGTLDLGIRGTYAVEMWLQSPTEGILRLSRDSNVWQCPVVLIPADPMVGGDAYWHTIFDGGELFWRYRVRGEMRGGEFMLSFDDSCPQRCPGGARVDENGRVMAEEGEVAARKRRQS